jgi:hypothetical protein
VDVAFRVRCPEESERGELASSLRNSESFVRLGSLSFPFFERGPTREGSGRQGGVHLVLVSYVLWNVVVCLIWRTDKVSGSAASVSAAQSMSFFLCLLLF